MSTPLLHQTFADPPREFGIMPFWFWNDDLEEAELLRQLNEFHAKGFGGVLIHPRVGLSRRVGYLTDEYFRLVRRVVEEAARLEMKVVLYDEGSYPSGSAAGQVVAENPDFASRCIFPRHTTIEGPAEGYWHPNPGRALRDELVAVIMGRETGPNQLDPDSLTVLPIQEPELVRYQVPAGTWQLIAVWQGFSGGAIRGVFPEQEDQHAQAPAAGDILSPEAVACFINLTHEQYYAHLSDHFGSTVVAMFTDEPMVLGRGARRRPHPWPYTPGLLDDLQEHWPGDDVARWLPALWLDCGPQTDAFKAAFTQTVYDRLERVFYGAQGRWCAEHGIALTGHPAESNDFGALRQFQWPGQDMVWRWVVPGSDTALEGPHSCAPKCAASAAVLQNSRRNASEALGAYGWQLTLDEAKWLLDWHMVRGNNLFYLHACFYSVRGRRAYESEPDLGLHNTWWPHFQWLGDYLRRVCWLLSDGEEVCNVAIFTDGNAAAWQAARRLYENQIDFLYIDAVALADATVVGNHLQLGQQTFQAIVCDPPLEPLPPALAAFAEAGGLVLNDGHAETLVTTLTTALGRDLHWPHTPDLRALHYRKNDHDFYYLVNEGEAAIEGELSLAATGSLECWDPLAGTAQPWPAEHRDGRLHTRLRLERRQSLILAVTPQAEPQPDAAVPPQAGEMVLPIDTPWQAFDAANQPIDLPCPGDWAQLPGWETYSGSLQFETRFTLSAAQAAQVAFLDLGQVGDIAAVTLNGQSLGVCAWEPYLFRLHSTAQAGENTLRVTVTNAIANHYEGLQRPSGLLGPVTLRQHQV